MSDLLKQFSKEIEDLKRIHADVKGKAHDAESALEGTIDALEDKWAQVEKKWKSLHDLTGDAAKNVGEEIKHLLHDLRETYKRLKKKL